MTHEQTTGAATPQLRERLAEVFAAIIADDVELRADLTADDVDAWDSLSHVNFMFAVEEEFGVQLSEHEMVLADIGELEEVLARKLGAQGA